MPTIQLKKAFFDGRGDKLGRPLSWSLCLRVKTFLLQLCNFSTSDKAEYQTREVIGLDVLVDSPGSFCSRLAGTISLSRLPEKFVSTPRSAAVYTKQGLVTRRRGNDIGSLVACVGKKIGY